jgi:hypothetical protein
MILPYKAGTPMFDFLAWALSLPREECTEILDRAIAGISRNDKEPGAILGETAGKPKTE